MRSIRDTTHDYPDWFELSLKDHGFYISLLAVQWVVLVNSFTYRLNAKKKKKEKSRQSAALLLTDSNNQKK